MRTNTWESPLKIFDLCSTTVLASAGLCGAALAFSPSAAAAPLPTGGPACLQQQSGLAAAPIEQMSGSAVPAAAGGAAAAPACIEQMAGLAAPVVLPGPPVPPAPVPASLPPWAPRKPAASAPMCAPPPASSP